MSTSQNETSSFGNKDSTVLGQSSTINENKVPINMFDLSLSVLKSEMIKSKVDRSIDEQTEKGPSITSTMSLTFKLLFRESRAVAFRWTFLLETD